MTTFTKEQLIEEAKEKVDFFRGRLELIPQSQRIALSLHLAEITLASLEAEPVAWTDADELRDAKNGGSGYLFSIGGDANKFADPRRKLVLYTYPPVFETHSVSFDDLRDAVSEVSGGLVMAWNDIYKGHHAVPFINFNSLARIVDKFRTAPPAPVVLGGWEQWIADAVEYLEGGLEADGELEAEGSIEAKRLLSRRAAMLQGKADPREVVRTDHAEWSQATFGSVGPVGPLKHLSKEALEAAAEPGDLSEWADMQFLLWDAQRRAGITDEQITQAMIDKLAVNKSRQWPEPKDGEPRLHIKAAPQPEVK